MGDGHEKVNNIFIHIVTDNPKLLLAAENSAVEKMSFELVKDGVPILGRRNNGEYWLNGFEVGKPGSPAGVELKGAITFKTPADARAFMRAKPEYYAGRGDQPKSYQSTRHWQSQPGLFCI